MPKVIWRHNQVISIETRRKDEDRKENIYVLAQMISKTQLLVFNLFNSHNQWDNVELSKVPILFCTNVLARQFITQSNVFKQNIEPLKNYEPPKNVIDIGMEMRRIVLWKGTEEEKEIWMLGRGGGRLIEGHIGNYKVIIPKIDLKDNETIDQYELDTIRKYAELNERLYLCYKFGRNVDPMKDMVFNRPIPLDYKEYIYIISS